MHALFPMSSKNTANTKHFQICTFFLPHPCTVLSHLNNCEAADQSNPATWQSGCTRPAWHCCNASAPGSTACTPRQTQACSVQQTAVVCRIRCSHSTARSEKSQNCQLNEGFDPPRFSGQWSVHACELRWLGRDCRWAGLCHWGGSHCRFHIRPDCQLGIREWVIEKVCFRNYCFSQKNLHSFKKKKKKKKKKKGNPPSITALTVQQTQQQSRCIKNIG